jgi:hypothetical protein
MPLGLLIPLMMILMIANVTRMQYAGSNRIYIIINRPNWRGTFMIGKRSFVGISKMQSRFFIINDDVSFSLSIIDAIYDHITPENGTITIDSKSVRRPILSLNGEHKWIENVSKDQITLEPCDKLRHKAAVMIGIHKDSYEFIPEELLIHFNDYFLFKICILRKKQNLSIMGANAHTDMSTTVSKFPEITKQEQRIYPGIFAKYKIKDIIC